jgi:hypothetical protein
MTLAAPQGMPPRWWRRPLPKGGRSCYRTKADALKVFADENYAVIEEYGGIDYNVSPAEFDAINHKYGLKGNRRARNIAEALWAAVPPTRGRQVCLEDIDLQALNDTSPAREAREAIGVEFRLPDYIEEDILAKQEEEYYRRQLGGPRMALRKKGTHLKATSTRGWKKASPESLFSAYQTKETVTMAQMKRKIGSVTLKRTIGGWVDPKTRLIYRRRGSKWCAIKQGAGEQFCSRTLKAALQRGRR